MMPIPSYQAARVVSVVTLVRSLSPFLTPTLQLRGVAVIERSHDTGPLGS
jgi:hypothetical protein